MEEKKKYESPEVEVIDLGNVDIITSSDEGEGEPNYNGIPTP